MDRRICFFGDSFVNGTGDPDCLGWVGRVCAAAWHRGHNVTCYNGGIRRDTSGDIQARWRKEADSRLPENCSSGLVFSFGVNDCIVEAGKRRVELALTRWNANAILAGASAFAPTLAIGPPPIADRDVNQRVEKVVAAIAEVCGALKVPFLDVFPTLQSSPLWLNEIGAGDGAHPSRGGYQELASLIDQWPEWRAWVP